MNELLALEALGYRFELDADGSVRYQLYGPEPPPDADALLAALDRDQVRQILLDRQQGFVTVAPQDLRIPWPMRWVAMRAIKQALDDGLLLDVKVTYVRRTRECVYHLTPPGVDLTAYMEGAKADEQQEEG